MQSPLLLDELWRLDSGNRCTRDESLARKLGARAGGRGGEGGDYVGDEGANLDVKGDCCCEEEKSG